MARSKCCDANMILSDICSECKEHCEEQDFFDSHFIIVGLDKKESDKMKHKIKEQLGSEVSNAK
jgi:hypothetical protein